MLSNVYFLPHKLLFYFTILSRLVLGIFRFIEEHAQNLSTPAE